VNDECRIPNDERDPNENTKHQAPNTKETPNSSQRHWGFGAWIFSGAWCLVFGVLQISDQSKNVNDK
jgi:hypothetical protein